MTGSYTAPISWCIYHKKLITIEINNIIKLTVYISLKLPELQVTKSEHKIMITISFLMCWAAICNLSDQQGTFIR